MDLDQWAFDLNEALINSFQDNFLHKGEIWFLRCKMLDQVAYQETNKCEKDI